MSRKWLVVAALALLALASSGCPLLMVGSLGYTGYEYEKTGTIPGMPKQDSSGSSSDSSSKKPESQSTPDSSIE